LYVM